MVPYWRYPSSSSKHVFAVLTSAGQYGKELQVDEYVTQPWPRSMLGKTAQLRTAGPGVKVHCQSFAYGPLQNGYGRAPQSRPRRQHGRQRTDDDDRQPTYKEELPGKDHGQTVD